VSSLFFLQGMIDIDLIGNLHKLNIEHKLCCRIVPPKKSVGISAEPMCMTNKITRIRLKSQDTWQVLKQIRAMTISLHGHNIGVIE